jgi:hypothetical protein
MIGQSNVVDTQSASFPLPGSLVRLPLCLTHNSDLSPFSPAMAAHHSSAVGGFQSGNLTQHSRNLRLVSCISH